MMIGNFDREESLAAFVKFLGKGILGIKTGAYRFDEKKGKYALKITGEAYFEPISVNKACDYIDLRDGKNQIWITLQELKGIPEPNSKGNRYHSHEDISHYTNIYLDVDAVKPTDLKDYAATQKERDGARGQLPAVERWLAERGFSCGLKLFTGNGCGVVLPIPATPATPEFIAKVATFLRIARDVSGCDIDPTMFDPGRVIGIPGTINAKLEMEDRKNQRREAIGGIPLRIEDQALLDFILSLDPDPTALKEWAKKYEEPLPNASPQSPQVNDVVGVEDILDRLNTILEDDPKLKSLLDGKDLVRFKNDRSDAEYGAAGKLVKYGFTDPEIDYIMCHVSKIGKWAEEGDHYRFEQTLRKLREVEQGQGAEEQHKDEGAVISEEELESIEVEAAPPISINLEPDNFVSQYINYGKYSCDAFPDYHMGIALALLSIAVNRNLIIRLKQMDLFTNVWLFLLGPTTIARKTVAIGLAEKILKRLLRPYKLSESHSPEGFLEELTELPRAYYIRDEASSLLAAMEKPYMGEMRELLCNLFDCKGEHRKLRTSQRNKKSSFDIQDPYITEICATTGEAFRELTTKLDITSGWLVRFLYIYPTYRKESRPFELADGESDLLFDSVLKRYEGIAGKLFNLTSQRAVQFAPDAFEYYQKWQMDREAELQSNPDLDNIKAALWGRLSTYALKMAALFTVGRSDYSLDTKVSLSHVQEACRIVDNYLLPTSVRVADMVAMEETKNLQNRVIGILRQHGGKIARKRLLQILHLKLSDVKDALEALMESEEIVIIHVSNKGARPTHWIILNQININKKPREDKNQDLEVDGPNNIDSPNNINSRVSRVNSSVIIETNGTNTTNGTGATVVGGSEPFEGQPSPYWGQLVDWSEYLGPSPFGEDGELDWPALDARIKQAISEGGTDPERLAEIVGLPVCIMARHAGNFPGVDLRRAGEILVTLGRASFVSKDGGSGKPAPSLAEELQEVEVRREQEEDRKKTPVRLKAIYTSSGEALEYADFSLNLYAGCSHGCGYCYNRGKFRSPCTVLIKKSSLENIEYDLKQLAALEIKTPIHLSFIGDAFDLGREDNSFTYQVLELFKKYQHPFRILTKGGMKAIQEPDIFFDGCWFGCTLTFDNPEDSKKWEPGAALPEDRIAALEIAHSKGIRTWVSLEPVIDPTQTLHLIELTHGSVDHYGVGKLNHDAALEKTIDWSKFRTRAEALMCGLGFRNQQRSPEFKTYMIKQALKDATWGDGPPKQQRTPEFTENDEQIQEPAIDPEKPASSACEDSDWLGILEAVEWLHAHRAVRVHPDDGRIGATIQDLRDAGVALPAAQIVDLLRAHAWVDETLPTGLTIWWSPGSAVEGQA